MSAKPYSFIVTISAKSEERADAIRDEIVGGAEDLLESGEARGADIWSTKLESGDQAEMLTLYRALHDRVSDLVEDGKLSGLKEADPKAYEALVESLVQLAGLDPKPVEQLQSGASPAL